MTDELEQIRALRPNAPLPDGSDLETSRAAVVRATAERRRPIRRARWQQPALAGLAVAAVVGTVLVVTNHGTRPDPAGAPPTSTTSQAASPTISSSATSSARSRVTTAPIKAAINPASKQAVVILHDAATRLRTEPRIPTPAASAFYYFRTTQAENWISISGKRVGEGLTTSGHKATWPGCRYGRDITPGESGSCTPAPAYLGDAPTTAARWPGYIEHSYFPGAIANGAAGKAAYQLLYTNLMQPAARAALLDWIATCHGVTTHNVAPVNGRRLIGVTCPGLQYLTVVFGASDHHLAGTIWYGTGPAELFLKTGVVAAIGERP